MSKRIIVLDAGGVLLTEPVPELLATMAQAGRSDPAAVAAYFQEELYFPLWSGSLLLADFWDRLRSFSGAPNDNSYWENFFVSRLRPAAGMGQLHRLRGADRVVILSNHLAQWLRPHLRQPVRQGLIDQVLISSETGHVKPKPEAFLDIYSLAGVADDDEILMVDDRPANLRAAEKFGFLTLHGGQDDGWVAPAVKWTGRGVKPV